MIKNILTFNPGWNQNAEAIEDFTDVRELKLLFEAKGIEILQDSITAESGPASFTIMDSDGDSILFDQHV